MSTTERIFFRLLVMECCNHQLCWVNPRLPTYCPECGERVYPAVKSWAAFSDEKATIRYKTQS